MESAIIVPFLAGLVIPILMLLAAVLFDALVVIWAFFRIVRDEWWPKLRHGSPGVSHRLALL